MSSGITASFVIRFSSGTEIRVEDLHVARSGITVLFGASGAGKSTVLRCLAGLEQPDEGVLRYDDEAWFDAEQRLFVAPKRRQLGFVPQDYALFPHLSVARNIAYGLHQLPVPQRRERLRETITWLGLQGLEQRLPGELSGGQQQRVALARALAPRPRLLLLDEPWASLDLPTRSRLRGELRQLLAGLSIPTVLVTHDRNEALALGDSLVVMHDGRNVQQGPVHEVFSRPANVIVAGIVAVETVEPGQIVQRGELVSVRVGERELKALGSEVTKQTGRVYVCIRAEDVVLVRDEAPKTSARNCLPARVRGFTNEGPMVRISLDCGFPLMALLTRQACEEMALKENDTVLALIKVPQIHLIPRSEA